MSVLWLQRQYCGWGKPAYSIEADPGDVSSATGRLPAIASASCNDRLDLAMLGLHIGYPGLWTWPDNEYHGAEGRHAWQIMIVCWANRWDYEEPVVPRLERRGILLVGALGFSHACAVRCVPVAACLQANRGDRVDNRIPGYKDGS